MEKQTTENPHKPFVIEREGAETAVLMVHGFLGSPLQFEPMAQILTEQGNTTMAILLPGHGGSAKDFARTGREKWMQAVEEAAESLREKYKRIILVGHSLGGLLTLNEAIRNGADGIVLISVPMRLRNNYHVLPLTLQMFWGDEAKDDDVMKYERSVFSIAKRPLRHHLLSWPRAIDLLQLMRETEKSLDKVRVPVLIIQSRGDQTVASRSAGILERGLQNCTLEVVMLEKSGHSFWQPDEAEQMYERISRFIKSTI